MFILPSMSRPDQCAEILKRIKDSGATSKGVLVVNGRSHAEKYADELRVHTTKSLPENWRMMILPENLGCIGAMNKVFKMYPDEPWYGFIADDEYLMKEPPPDWDKRLIEAAGDWGIAHAWENWHNGRRCQGYPVIGGKLVRAIGYMALPTTWHNFGFDSMYDWLSGQSVFGGGGLLNMVCVPEVKIEHNRAKPDLEIDDCYKLADSTFEQDRNRFWDWVRRDMPIIVKRIREQIALESHF